MKEQWQGFKDSKWQDEVDVRDFIQNNYKPYNGDESFLEGPTESTNTLWTELQELQKKNVPKAVYWIWKQKWFQVLQLMALDI